VIQVVGGSLSILNLHSSIDLEQMDHRNNVIERI
jgi:hypothetical protein